jgi:AraC-like DNA-binding protein
LAISFSPFEVLLLIGVVHGFVIATLIWFKKVIHYEHLLLSFILLVFNLLCIKIIILSSGLWQQPAIRYFPLPFDLAIQPLFYLYVSSLTKPDFRSDKKHLIHFAPFFISLAYSLFIYMSVLPTTDLAGKDRLADRFLFNEVKEVEDFLSVCSAVVYWLLSRNLVKRYRRWLFSSTSDTLLPTYSWLKNILALYGTFFILISINILLDYFFGFGKRFFFHWQVTFVYLALLIYYLGFRGYNSPALSSKNFTQPPTIKKTDEFQQEVVKSGTATETLVAETTDDSLTNEHHAAIANDIINAFEKDKLHLDAQLTLQTLSKKLNLNPVLVSRVINDKLKKNFRNLVNEYRVTAVMERLEEPKNAYLSLLGIAYECGFNSEASFYRIFKSMAGVSPKEYQINQSKK